MTIFIITALVLGIILGLLLAWLTLWIVKVKCPKCKQLKSVVEVITWQWKARTITGQPCLTCQKNQRTNWY